MRLRRLRPFAGPRIGPVPSYPHRKLQSAVMAPPGFRSPMMGPPLFSGRARLFGEANSAEVLPTRSSASVRSQRSPWLNLTRGLARLQEPGQARGRPANRGRRASCGRKPGIRMPLGPANAECRTAEKCLLPADDRVEKIENASRQNQARQPAFAEAHCILDGIRL